MNASQIEEKLLKPKAGIPVLIFDLAMLVASILAMIAGLAGGGFLGLVLMALGAAAFIAVFIVLAGLKAVRPNEALVLTLFGNYYGTIKEPGYYFVNPFCSSVSPAYDKAAAEKAKREKEAGGNPSSTTQISSTRNRVSLKTMTLDNGRQKVNDVIGNPIIIGAVVIWHVENPTKAVFNVEDYPSFLSTQTDSTIRNIARLYPYDVFDEGEESDTVTEKTLRGSSQEIAGEHEAGTPEARLGRRNRRRGGAHNAPGLRRGDRRRHAPAPAGRGRHCRAPEDSRRRGRHGEDGRQQAR